jgi:WD40 repeat protein
MNHIVNLPKHAGRTAAMTAKAVGFDAFARSWEGEPLCEPNRNPGRTEPRLPRITQSHLVRRGIMIVLIIASARSTGNAEEPAPSPPYSLTFSPDGRRLAVATGKPKSIVALSVWETATLRRQWAIADRYGIVAVAFSPDGLTLAVGRFSDEALLVDGGTGKQKKAYGGHGKAARAVAFAPDGNLLAVGSYEGFIKLWDATRSAEVRTLRGHRERIYEVKFSPDGTRLLSVGIDDARVWEVSTGREQHVLTHGGSLVRSGLFSPDGKSVITGGWDGTLRSWDVETGTPTWRLASSGSANILAYSPSRDLLAIGGSSRRIKLVSPVFRECEVSQRRHLELLLTRLEDDSYAVREAASREILEMGLMAEPSLLRLMTESRSAEVRMRCRFVRQQILTMPRTELSGHRDEVDSVAISPDGNLLASVDKAGMVALWDIGTRRVRGHFVPSENTGHFDEDLSHGGDQGHPGR